MAKNEYIFKQANTVMNQLHLRGSKKSEKKNS